MSDSAYFPSDVSLRARDRVSAGTKRASGRTPRGPRVVKFGLIAIVLFVLAAALSVAIINVFMTLKVKGDTATVANAPNAQAAIILGALVNADGTLSPMLADRVARGAELYKAGKVDSVIVSGDHGTWGYDEPTTMRKALQAQGVPASKIFTDHAGFDTWATMKRAREVFKVETALVVTQGFHMTRSLYLADAAGLKATGVTSDIQPYGRQQRISEFRELPARVKAFRSATFDSKVLLGPAIPVESSDSRVSWGPAGPPSK
jgi:SanA protein